MDVKDRPMSLHPLVYLVEGDEVTIGRTDTDSYAIFPPDGAEVVRRLESGMSPQQAADWYHREYGEQIDIEHVVAALDELGFVRAGEPDTAGQPGTAPVRGRRLGAALFSPVAWVCYTALVLWAVVAAIRAPDLVPTYRSVFFTDYYAVMEIVLLGGVIPLLLGHEAFHVLAARRLGVRSKLGISRRLYFLVLETRLDGLVAVPRRRRYLPILAGIVFDVLVTAAFVVTADLTRGPDGELSLAGRLCMAFAFTTLIRIAWQGYCHLRTDLYVLATTILGCVDLHNTTRRLIADVTGRWLRPHAPRADRSTWHPVDRRVARWWAWCVVGGYAFSIATLAVAALPIVIALARGLLDRFTGESGSTMHLVDAALFLALTGTQVAVSTWLWARERRHRSTTQHVIS